MRMGMGPGAMMRGGPGVWAQEKREIRTPLTVLLPRIGGVLGEFKRQMFWALGTILVSSALQMVPPYVTRHVIDTIIPIRDEIALGPWLVALLVVHGMRYALMYWSRISISAVSQQFVYAMARNLFEHVGRLSLRFYERQGTGEIISRATSDINILQQAMQGGVVQAAAGLFNMLAYAIVLAILDWRLALIVYISLPILVASAYISSEMLRVRYVKVQENMSKVNSVLAENITGVRVARAFAREAEQSARFDNRNRESLSANMSTAMVQAISGPVIQIIGIVSTGIVLWAGAVWVIDGSLSIGTLIAFVSYLVTFYAPIEDLIRVNSTIQQALASAERVFEFMDEPTEVVEKLGAIELGATGTIKGDVRLEGVTFSYLSGQPVLRDVSITARPNTMTALVGHTGSGKTTMMNLLPRFYDVDSGRVTIDGHDVRDLTIESLRSQIGVVLQETFLFSATVRENIRYGRLDATDEEVEVAARDAYADDFIRSLPKGYEAEIGESGALLSRGQRQRLALARAILRNPRILIMDEATSDVDTETEVMIQKALERVMRGRTVFVIAHRLSTIRHADQICVLDHGVLVETGTHEELLARPGAYRGLYEIQFSSREEPTTASVG